MKDISTYLLIACMPVALILAVLSIYDMLESYKRAKKDSRYYSVFAMNTLTAILAITSFQLILNLFI